MRSTSCWFYIMRMMSVIKNLYTPPEGLGGIETGRGCSRASSEDWELTSGSSSEDRITVSPSSVYSDSLPAGEKEKRSLRIDLCLTTTVIVDGEVTRLPTGGVHEDESRGSLSREAHFLFWYQETCSASLSTKIVQIQTNTFHFQNRHLFCKAPFTRSKPVYSKPVCNAHCCVYTCSTYLT